MYGDRRDPVAVLAGLGERLSAAVDSDDVLPSIVEVGPRQPEAPSCRGEVRREAVPACASGDRPERTVDFEFVHAGEHLGVLVVGLRRGEADLSQADARLLTAFARQAGVAAHGVRASRELRRSRERVVLSREEERPRLRRELHDGLV